MPCVCRCLRIPERGHWIPSTGAAGTTRHGGCWERNLGPLSQQQGLLGAGPSLPVFLPNNSPEDLCHLPLTHTPWWAMLALGTAGVQMSLAVSLSPVMLRELMALTSCLASLSLQLPRLPKQLLEHKSHPSQFPETPPHPRIHRTAVKERSKQCLLVHP